MDCMEGKADYSQRKVQRISYNISRIWEERRTEEGMFNCIRYYESSDVLYFDIDEVGECTIDKDGDFLFDEEQALRPYISIETMKKIIALYENRKKYKVD